MLNAAVPASVTRVNPKNIDPEIFLIKIWELRAKQTDQRSHPDQRPNRKSCCPGSLSVFKVFHWLYPPKLTLSEL
jgi:hypothetical protein